MRTDKLVLFKSKTQRCAEMIVMPAVALGVGPAMRTLLGDSYSPSNGLLAAIFLVLVMAVVGRQLAPRLGGEWVTDAERQHRLAVEAGTTPLWHCALPAAVMALLSLSAFCLIVDPVENFGHAVGSPLATMALFAVISLGAGYRAIIGRRALVHSARLSEPRQRGPWG